MVIKCTISIPFKSIGDYAKQITALPPLPEYITKRGPYINDASDASNEIITIYEFDKSKFAEAYENISKHINAFRGVPGFTFCAKLLTKHREVKPFQIITENRSRA
jgi:hypothetical protein